ncbi:dihydrofolate reductase family protein [Micromonospora sp. ATCC 39149]|uniref:Dihydrofolate reductase family protein n=1 Tax=Micromonospora carbonacea TaxID=47853 RepID=A0A7D6CA26_9ACTN|nr:dihydrofolate reductase family protein [Micromonospora sp. ATCC 39149]QLJ97862.1 dihydrofolate reductase family protein [Micromonospora carbonacea]
MEQLPADVGAILAGNGTFGGSAEVARQRIRAGPLDEVLIFVAPVLLGAGVRIFGCLIDRLAQGRT